MFGDLDFSNMFGAGPAWEEPDYILTYLVSALVNIGGAPLGVTLMVKGTIITGTLMSEREYLDTMTAMLQDQVRSALSELPSQEREMAESAFDLRDLIEDSYPDEDEDGDEDDDEMPTMDLVHLHLRNPMVLSPQPSIGFSEGPMPVMRIRLAQVDGWMLGASIPDDLDDFVPPNVNNQIKH